MEKKAEIEQKKNEKRSGNSGLAFWPAAIHIIPSASYFPDCSLFSFSFDNNPVFLQQTTLPVFK